MEHSPIGGSGASVWLRCPGSIHMQMLVPNETNEAAERGTLMHEAAARAINFRRTTPGLPEDEANIVQDYVNILLALRETATHWGVEQRVSGEIHEAAFGTIDYYDVTDDTLRVLDFKTGQVYVPAKNNDQLQYYAAMLLPTFGRGTTIKYGIYQPAINPNVEWWEQSCEAQAAWTANAKVQAVKAMTPGAPLVAGDHCGKCRALGICGAGRGRLGLIRQQTPPSVLSAPELTEALRLIPSARKWCSAIEDYAESLAKAGALPGWHMVDGRKSPLAWSKTLDPATCPPHWKETVLKSATQVAKVEGEAKLVAEGKAYRPPPSQKLAEIATDPVTEALTDW